MDDMSRLAMDAKKCDLKKTELAGVTYQSLLPVAVRKMDERGFLDPEDVLGEFFCQRFHDVVELYDFAKGQSWRSFSFARFNFFILDYQRKPESQPTANYVSRYGRKTRSVSTELLIHANNESSTIGNSLAEDRRDADAEFDQFNDHLSVLSHRQRLLMILYYVESMTMKQVGKQMGVSESRISQMHTQCLVEIKQSKKAVTQ